MSILIKDLEMPTCCWDCPIQVNPFCAANDIIDLDERTKRPDKCPLTKVPEDVQPVVRCINCKYYEGLACCKLIGDCGGTNWFCGWGEPKEET